MRGATSPTLEDTADNADGDSRHEGVDNQIWKSTARGRNAGTTGRHTGGRRPRDSRQTKR